MFTIISYDIVEDKRRTKVLKLMKGYGDTRPIQRVRVRPEPAAVRRGRPEAAGNHQYGYRQRALLPARRDRSRRASRSWASAA